MAPPGFEPPVAAPPRPEAAARLMGPVEAARIRETAGAFPVGPEAAARLPGLSDFEAVFRHPRRRSRARRARRRGRKPREPALPPPVHGPDRGGRTGPAAAGVHFPQAARAREPGFGAGAARIPDPALDRTRARVTYGRASAPMGPAGPRAIAVEGEGPEFSGPARRGLFGGSGPGRGAANQFFERGALAVGGGGFRRAPASLRHGAGRWSAWLPHGGVGRLRAVPSRRLAGPGPAG